MNKRYRQTHRFIEPLEPRLVLDGMPIINEIMAINDNALTDEDGTFPDWLEIKNTGNAAIDLAGYYLTNDPAKLDLWSFPSTILSPGQLHVVFASEKNRSVSGQQLHTNFNLDGDGQFLALVKPDGSTIVSQFDIFPGQFADISFGWVPNTTGTSPITLVDDGSPARAILPDSMGDVQSGGHDWPSPHFNDATNPDWFDVKVGIGFDTGSGTSISSKIHPDGNLTGQMSGEHSTALLRIPFQVDSPAMINELTLSLDYNDGFVALLNNVEVGRQNASGDLLNVNAEATTTAGTGTGSSQLVNTYVGPTIAQGGGPDVSNITVTAGPALPLINSAVNYQPFRLVDGSGFGGSVPALGSNWDDNNPPGSNAGVPEIDNIVDHGMMALATNGINDIPNQWVSFDLGVSISLSEMWIWGMNEINRSSCPQGKCVNRSVSSAKIWYSNDPSASGATEPDTKWTQLPGDIMIPKGDPVPANLEGSPTFDNVAKINFDSVQARHVLIDIESNYARDLGISDPFVGLSEVQFFTGGRSFEHEEIEIHQSLVAGTNVLAIQGLNFSATDGDFLIQPQLHGVLTTIGSEQLGYTMNPTPGAENSSGFPAELPIINEFMALNGSTLVDQNGDSSDWLEIHNPSTVDINLDGWYLTDDSDDLQRWQLPSVTIPAKGYQIVFTSGKNRAVADHELHTNFALSGDGEYLALVMPDGNTVVSEFSANFPAQFGDVSFGKLKGAFESTLIPNSTDARVRIPNGANNLTDGNHAWYDPAFNDSTAFGWFSATSGLGFDATGSSTVGPLVNAAGDLQEQMHHHNASVLTRFPFQANNVDDIESLHLTIDYNNGYVAYLNGTEIARQNAPSGTPAFNATTNSSNLVLANQYLSTLPEGDNSTNITTIASANGGAAAGAAGAGSTYGSDKLVDGNFLGQSPGKGEVGGELQPSGFYGHTTDPDPHMWVAAGAGFQGITINEQYVGFSFNDGSHTFQTMRVWNFNEITPPTGMNQTTRGVKDMWIWYADALSLPAIHGGPGATHPGAGWTLDRKVTLPQAPHTGTYDGVALDLGDFNARHVLFMIDSNYGDANYVGLSEVQFFHTGTMELGQDNLDISQHANKLVSGNNLLAIHGLNTDADDNDFLLRPQLTATSMTDTSGVSTYITNPTPGALNASGTIDEGPFIENISHSPTVPKDSDPLVVTAAIRQKFSAPKDVLLHYRVMYSPEVETQMFDDGLHGDGNPGDGIYGAMIPANASGTGDMIRYYVTASDSQNHMSRWPLNAIANSPDYLGTVVDNLDSTSDLPRLKWFTQNTSAAQTRSGTRASLFYQNEFYDNVFIRLRGNSSNFGPKKNFKFDFNRGYDFLIAEGENRVTEINIANTYWDKAYLRTSLAYETFRQAGVPAPLANPIRMDRNGDFFMVAHLVEQIDEDFLIRHGLDPEGAMYKFERNPVWNATNALSKRTRRHESNSDLQAVVNGIHPSNSRRAQYLFDNINLPQVINYLAAGVIIQDVDRIIHNNFMYRDTNGNGEWYVFPWDKDLTFGTSHIFDDADVIWADDENNGGDPLRSGSHPLHGDSEHRWYGATDLEWNRLIDAIHDTPATQQMLMRRLRTLMDEFLQPPGTPVNELKFEQRLDELKTIMNADVLLDRAKWGTLFGQNFNFATSVDRIRNLYLAQRRPYLYEDKGPSGSGLIPGSQPNGVNSPLPTINFGQIEFDPISGNQDEEYIELVNPLNTAVDISGWHLSGGIQHIFQPGVVIPAQSSLYVSPDVKVFRNRTTGPSKDQELFVQGNYEGHLSNHGETIQLVGKNGQLVNSVTTPAAPTDPQRYLRVSELHYNPAGSDTTEFIELTNISSGAQSTTLNLAGVTISAGPSEPFTFPTGTTLAPGEYLVVTKNTVAFQAAYPLVNAAIIAGPFIGSLSNGGEQIKLDDPNGSTILSFNFNDNEPWPQRADGDGASLELIAPTTTPIDQYGKYYHWRGSISFGGSPGNAGQEPIGIIINEVLSRTDPPVVETDSIELYNSTNTNINIGGWYLSDSSDNFLKYEIPDGTILSAGGYLVFDESHFNPNPTSPASTDFALSGTTGDDVWLTIANDSSGISFFVDDVHFGAAAVGESLGRTTDGSDRLIPMQTITLSATNSPARIGPLVFSELNYHPGFPSSEALTVDPTLQESDLEFIEIFNPTTAAIDLTDWRIRGGVDYDFLAATTIGAGEVMVVISFDPQTTANMNRLAAFRAHYGIDTGTVLVGPYRNQLSNSDDHIKLQRPGDPTPEFPPMTPVLLEDQVLYDDLAPWPITADGTGITLHRTPPNSLGIEPLGWSAAAPGPGHPDRLGDTDLDGDVDTADLTTAIVNFTSAGGTGKTWSEGDIDGDGDVDTSDLTTAIIHFTGAMAQTRFSTFQLTAVSLDNILLPTNDVTSHKQTPSDAPAKTVTSNSDTDSLSRIVVDFHEPVHPRLNKSMLLDRTLERTFDWLRS